MGFYQQFTRNRRARRCKSRRQKPAMSAFRHPATDGTHVVMDWRVMSPVQLQPRIASDDGYSYAAGRERQ
jgi:hypothetical protein